MARATLARPSCTAMAVDFAAAIRPMLDGPAATATPPRLFTALSGGPDSTALACLAEEYAANHGLRHTALIVDHRIRGDSAAEARRVADRMRRRDVAVEILTVSDNAPMAGIQAWARARRYELMLARVRLAGGCLLLGHHAGDQAETVMMRLQKSSGLVGLAAMKPVSCRAGVTILRPLLEMSARSLVDYCHACNVGFESDPSNLDHRFERVRVRAALAAMQRDGSAMSDRLMRLGRAAGSIDRALLHRLADGGYLPAVRPSGHMLLPAAIAGLPAPIVARLLAHVIGQVARPSTPPSLQALSRLAARLADGRAATLGGARFANHQGDWLVTAEIGRRPPRAQVRAGESAIFAGVWEIGSPVDAVIRHLGAAGSGAGRDWAGTAGWCAVPSLVRRALPVLETLDGALIYPHLQINAMCDDVSNNATARFLPLAMYRH
ncbi:MAG: tRNA lysidine(34) synthetase TilS [Candidatus Puniceispirillaceae bacterium]